MFHFNRDVYSRDTIAKMSDNDLGALRKLLVRALKAAPDVPLTDGLATLMADVVAECATRKDWA